MGEHATQPLTTGAAWEDEVRLRALKSLALVIETTPETGEIFPDLDVLAAWIIAWEEWVRAEAGFHAGKRMHLQYKRDVSIVTDLTVPELLKLQHVGETCHALRLGLSAPLILDSALAEQDLLAAHVSGHWINMVSLVIDDAVPDAKATEALITMLSDRGIQVRLSGDTNLFLQSGLLGSDMMNQRNVTINGRASNLSEGAPARNGCLALMRVYVDSTGVLYPCFGLLGVPEGRIGHIETVADGVIFDPHTDIDIDALALRGPEPDDCADPTERFGLPMQCERHRAGLLAARG